MPADGSAVDVWSEPDANALIASPERAESLAAAAGDLEEWALRGWRFLGVLDEDYPARVREVHQAPPFLFAAGRVVAEDRAVAVVGSRKAAPTSIELASRLASELVGEGITVLSGLADGIDAAAHRSALDAGGRTVAVIGTGIARSYPPANRDLQRRVAAEGLVLSQFWPDAPPQRHNFIMRNAVMSGYGRATVVIQAGEPRTVRRTGTVGRGSRACCAARTSRDRTRQRGATHGDQQVSRLGQRTANFGYLPGCSSSNGRQVPGTKQPCSG